MTDVEMNEIEKFVYEGVEAGRAEAAQREAVPCPFSGPRGKFFFGLGQKIGRAIERGEFPPLHAAHQRQFGKPSHICGADL